MPEPDLPDDAPGTQLFPQFESELYNMYVQEVDGLTDQQLDFESDRWAWARWSIRRNGSHVASGEVQFRIGDTEHRLGPGDSYLIPGDLPHYVRAVDPATLIEVFSPVREAFATD